MNGQMNVWECKLIFATGTLQQKIEITDLKPFLADENTSVLIILAATVYLECFVAEHICSIHLFLVEQFLKYTKALDNK